MKFKKTKQIGMFLFLVAFFQILLLVIFPLANSYSISQQDISITTQTVIVKKNKINGLSIKQIFSFNILPLVSAEDDPVLYCCQETNNGAICQDILSTATSSTEPTSCSNPIPTKCDLVSGCQRGCCFDPLEGLCSPGSPKQECLDGEGTWDNDDSCLISECQRGCCVMGNNAQFVTERRCENLAAIAGTEKDFRDIRTEPACLAVVASYDEGACILDGGACRFTTERACLSQMHGDFYGGYLCSAEEIKDLGSECEKQESIGCVNDKDEIYWFDSCGNRENIYSSDKDFSWNEGRILDKDLGCNPTESNLDDRNCGNCNIFASTKCSEVDSGTHVSDGDFICKDLRCTYNGKTYDNGESWCIYDGSIGERDSPFGKGQFASDTVGSEHWRAICIDGDVEIDRCGEYRGKICSQRVIEEGDLDFSIASCVMNEGTFCMGLNPEITDDMSESEIESELEIMREDCNENTHCMVKQIDIDTYFEFELCVPRYPKGADLTNGVDEGMCAFATASCTGTEEQKIINANRVWKWVSNKDCKNVEFVEQMNDLCVSLGDCGGYINYVGGGTNSLDAKRSQETVTWGISGESEGYTNKQHGGLNDFSWEDYKDFKNTVSGRYVVPQEIDDFIQSLLGEWDLDADSEEERNEKLLNWLGGISGVWGMTKIKNYGSLLLGTATETSATTTTLQSSLTLQSFGAAAIGAAIGTYIGYTIAKHLGLSGQGRDAMMFAGGLFGASLGYAIAIGLTNFWNPVGWAMMAAVFIALFTWLGGLGVTRDTEFDFECLPWQAPTGEANCEACNEDPLRPCTQYRCEAIGQTCKLLNEDLDVENPRCESIPYEPNPPEISPGMILDENSNFGDVQTNSVEIKSILRSDGCIQEFTPVSFTLVTDEAAQCKYDLIGTSSNFEIKENNFPKELNSFAENHTFEIYMPSLDSLNQYEIEGDLIDMYGNSKMYVRCQDYWENFNLNEYIVNFCVHSGPDESAVWHDLTRTLPENGGFLPYNTTQKDMKIWLNEPADCKYGAVVDQPYDLMPSNMSCRNSLNQKELFGWKCEADFTNLTAGENNFYIKCKDQPWKNITEDHLRNINEDDYIYTLYVTENPLEITSVLPQGIVTGGAEPISIDLEVWTSGGMSRGQSSCYYDWAGNWVMFFDTFSNHHKQEGLNLMGGNFNIPIKCEDEAQNIAYNNITFELDIDSSAPNVVRVYREGGSLRLITDEDAICNYHNLGTCNPFVIENSSSMTTGFSTIHSVNWDSQKTYYVKCEDAWGNMNPDCSIVVRPSSII